MLIKGIFVKCHVRAGWISILLKLSPFPNLVGEPELESGRFDFFPSLKILKKYQKKEYGRSCFGLGLVLYWARPLILMSKAMYHFNTNRNHNSVRFFHFFRLIFLLQHIFHYMVNLLCQIDFMFFRSHTQKNSNNHVYNVCINFIGFFNNKLVCIIIL